MARVSGAEQILSSFEGVDTAQSTVDMMLLEFLNHSPKHICVKIQLIQCTNDENTGLQ
jgi:hypothetical protein